MLHFDKNKYPQACKNYNHFLSLKSFYEIRIYI